MRQSYEELRNELLKSGALIPWQPGMELKNTPSDGAINPNTLGYQYTIQTTTLIRAKVIEQKFYEVPFADFVPTVVGEGAWMESIKTNLVYDAASPFEAGLQDLASNNSQIETVDVGTAPKTAVVKTWVKGYQYSTPEVEKALASNNWDVVSGKMKSLKRNWDLGLQKIAFLGLLQDLTEIPGLASQPNVNINLSVITANISSYSAAQFSALVATIMGAYFSNSNSTVLPDTFLIPMSDYLGLATPVASGFPIVSMLTYLEDAFKRITGNPNFAIAGNAYLDQSRNAGYWATNGTFRYILYRRDPETIRLDIPVDFVLSPAGTANNFQWQGVAAGQFTGAIAYREAELLYFDHT